MVTLSDFGAEDLGYLVIPINAPLGGILVIHDKWGLDQATKDVADRLGQMGYLTLAVDLCNGRTGNDADIAQSITQSMRSDSALKVVRAGVRLLLESPRLKVQRVALVGRGVGGEVCWRALEEVKDIEAVAAIEPEFHFDPKKIGRLRVPVCNVYADAYPQPPDALLEWQKLAQGKNSVIQQHVIGKRLDFSDPNSPFYDPAVARQAWDRAITFLERALAKPAEKPGIVDKIKSIF
jgi:carboxymethylenebutenolidase